MNVPLDITGDQLLAFSRNSRLTLAWPVFTSEPDDSKAPPDTPDPASLSGGKANEKPDKRWKIQLAVSEFAGGRWREKRVSDGALYTDFAPAAAYQRGADQLLRVVARRRRRRSPASMPDGYVGSFALTGCKGVPEPQQGGALPLQLYPRFVEHGAGRRPVRPADPRRRRGAGDQSGCTSALTAAIVGPDAVGLFNVTYPMQVTGDRLAGRRGWSCGAATRRERRPRRTRPGDPGRCRSARSALLLR